MLKKIAFICTTFIGSLLNASYIPAQGPLQLADICISTITSQNIVIGTQETIRIIHGVIHYVLRQKQNEKLIQPLLTICNVTTAEELPNYPVLVTIVQNMHARPELCVQATESLISLLLDLYNYNGYVDSHSSWPLNKIRKTWLKPSTWFIPWSYFVENDPILNQIINEIDQLAKIIEAHSVKKALHYRTIANEAYYFRILPIWITCAFIKQITA